MFITVLAVLALISRHATAADLPGWPDLPDLGECMPSAEMFDASGKIPSGIMSGNLLEIGAFDQCLAAKQVDPVTGATTGSQYCLVKVALPEDLIAGKDAGLTAHRSYVPEKAPEERIILNGLDPTDNSTGLVLGWCLPEKCAVQNATKAISEFLELPENSIKPILKCQTEEDLKIKLTAGEWTVVGFLCFILAVMILSTIYDMYLQYYKKDPAHIILIAFSVLTNGQKLLTVSHNPDQLPCLNGIRFLSMMWVLLGHRYVVEFMGPIINVKNMLKWMDDPFNMYIMNAPVSVDSFFVLSGLLVGYVFLLAKDKGVRFNVILFYLHRYIRLTPALAVVVLIHATIIKYFGSGPFWPLTLPILQDNCVDYWWSPLVYAQNYYNTQKMCVGQTWYLAVDTQLFFLSPLILVPLGKWPKPTMFASAALVVGSMVSSFVVTYHYDLPSFNADMSGSEKYMDYYYITTHTRFGPWLMGIMLGYYIYRLKKNKHSQDVPLHPAIVCFGWLVSLGLLLASLYAGHSLLSNSDTLGRSFFNGLHRHGWSLGLCWVIYACTQGYGGPINTFLSWSVFQVLGRFTYTIYLVHLSAQYMLVSSARTSSYFLEFHAMYIFWSDFFLSLVLAVILTLSFESPMLTIEKVLFRTGQKNKKTELPLIKNDVAINATPSTSGQQNPGFVKD